MSSTRIAPKQHEAVRPAEAAAAVAPESVTGDGVLLLHNRELFRPGLERFCRRLGETLVGEEGLRSATISLTAGTCQLDFAGTQVSDAAMADRFAAAVRASMGVLNDATPPGNQDRGWTSLTAFATGAGGSTWVTTREGSGLLRLRHPDLLADRNRARRVAQGLASLPGVGSARITLWGRELDVRFDPAQTSVAAIMAAAEAARQRSLQPVAGPTPARQDATPAVATGPRRLWNLTLAGGSFALTGLALVVPGLPTVPFLLATSYYLARSSPRLNARLLRSKFFGPILTDLETSGGLRRGNKVKLVGFTLVVGLVTVVVAGPPFLLLLVMAAVTAGSVYAITKIPGIPGESDHVPIRRSNLATA